MPEELRPLDGNDIPREHIALEPDVGIRQINRQCRIIVLDD